jgi:uncharacterized protein YgiM (DUF1202 family)
VTPVPVPKVRVLDTPTGYLNVRISPSIVGGEVVGRVEPGETYEYVAEEGGWFQIVLTPDEKGWVFGEYVEILPEAGGSGQPSSQGSESAVNPQVKILTTPTGYLNLRNAASLNGTRTGKVYPDEIYEYTATENGWYNLVLPDGKAGWVYGEYVEELGTASSFSPSQ